MYPSQGRFWLILAGVLVAGGVGCQQPEQKKTALGNLPGQMPTDVDPRVNATTYFAHGHLLEMQGQFERAVVQYRKAVALRPDFTSARNRLGITLNKLGRNEEATREFELAIANHPDQAYLHNNLGFSLYLEGKHRAAETTLARALELNPEFSRAHMNLALALARQSRFDEAYSELTRVGSAADANFNMGIILTEAEQYAEAARYLEEALAARPNFDAARQQLREVSRLAAELEARRAAELAAAEKAAQSPEPEPVDTIAADEVPDATEPESTGSVAGNVPVDVEPDTTETAVGDATAVDAEAVPTDTIVADEIGVDTEPEPTEPSLDDKGLPGDPGSVATEATEVDDPGAGPEPKPREPMEANVEVTVEESALETDSPPPPIGGHTTYPYGLVERSDIEINDLIVMANEALEALTSDPNLFVFEPPQTEQEPATVEASEDEANVVPDSEEEIDPELLFAMIDEAINALHKKRSAAFDALWCRVGYYLFPETAPDTSEPDQDLSTDLDELLKALREAPTGK